MDDENPQVIDLEDIKGRFQSETGITRKTRRVGVIGEKVGMTRMYDEWGWLHTVTVVRVEDCHVVQVKPEVAAYSKMGRMTMQVGTGTLKLKNATMPLIGHCAKAGLPPKRILHEFQVTPDAVLPEGTELTVRHYVPGQLVDVRGISRGKGYSGVIKRWGFKGLGASHGVGPVQRHAGSTGQCQDPGKVWKGKKMAGRMGGKPSWQYCMDIFGIDPAKNLLFLRGSVPGPNGGWIFIRDAWLRLNNGKAPYPSHHPSKDDYDSPVFMPPAEVDPFRLTPPGDPSLNPDATPPKKK